MPTPETESGMGDGRPAGIGSAAKQVAEQASALARLELELAGLELKRKAAALGLGIGMGLGAGVFGLFALGFMLAAIAAALATFLPTWLALLIVTVLLTLAAAVLGMVALRAIRKGTPPVPQQAIEEAKRTQAALRGNGS